MTDRSLALIRGVSAGAFFPAAALLLSWGLSRDISLEGALMPSAFMTSVAWWVSAILGTAVAINVSRRLVAGAVVGGLCVLLLQTVMVLWNPPEVRQTAAGTLAYWQAALLTIALPWAIGMVFGWTTIHRRPLRNDGAAPGASG